MDKKLKQRLVIAIVVVVLVVIFLPMFFAEKEEIKSNANSVVIPTAPKQSPLEQKLQPAPVEEEQPSEMTQQETVVKFDKVEQITDSIEANNIIQAALDTSIIVDEPQVEKPVKPVVKKAVPKKVVQVSQPQSKKVATVTAKEVAISKNHRALEQHQVVKAHQTEQLKKAQVYNQGWVVQLGSFNQVQNANALIKELRDRGFQAFGYSRIQAGKVVNRVYIGPFSQLDNAKEMHNQLSAMNIDNFVTQFNPIDID